MSASRGAEPASITYAVTGSAMGAFQERATVDPVMTAARLAAAPIAALSSVD
jgi:hypothetical protein